MKKILAALETARAAGTLRDVDVHLVRHLLALEPAPTPELALAIAALARANGDGNVCLDLAATAGSRLFAGTDGRYSGVPAPTLGAWREALTNSVLTGTAGARKPLILDAGDRLYLQKYFAWERTVVDAVTARLALTPPRADASLQAALDRCFPGRAPDDAQRQAAARAARHAFTVITGGPGTGKTTTVTRLLAVLVQLAGAQPLRIALAAPTGKAAARLGESILGALQGLRAEGLAEEWLARIPTGATTLHRLLGWRPDGFRHGADQPLPVDLLVVDEASMIDLPLMAKLLAAVPAHARLILLGDRDQLASVEAGNVLGDLCNHGGGNHGVSGNSAAPIAGSIAVLSHSHRFGADSGIGALARAANAGAADALAAAFRDHADVSLDTIPAAAMAGAAATAIDRHLAAYRHSSDPLTALQRFNRFRFLCALRDGPFGVHTVNRLAEIALAQAGLIDNRSRHYAGRPILISENDYAMQLFNGDTGLVWPDGDGRLRAFFSVGNDSVRSVALNRLPAHETCYAMTVHKSQGSEFDHVTLVLPDMDSPVLTRELVYTGITRARRTVAVWSPPALLATAIGRQVQRSSGLRDALWGAPPHPSPTATRPDFSAASPCLDSSSAAYD